jgi:beta-lactam-binding protein with PASTA domain
LIVSRGGQTSATVPDFRNMDVDEARDAAARAGLKLGQIVWTPLGAKGPPHGVVARQEPGPGARINSFEPIALQVSAGPHESGYLVRQAHLLVSVPVPDSATIAKQMKVRIAVTDATGRYDLYDAYAEPGQKLDFTVTSLGTSVVDMYVDNGTGEVLVGETRLGNEPPNAYGNGEPPPRVHATP